MNFRAILVSGLIFVIVVLATLPYRPESGEGADLGLACAAFLLSVIVFHIKPELLGKLNKPKEEAADEEDQQQSDSPS